MLKFIGFIVIVVKLVLNFFLRPLNAILKLILGKQFILDEEFPANTIEVIRPDDLLVLTFDFYHLKIRKSGKQLSLVYAGDGNSAYIVVRFPPQSVAEQAFFEPDTNFPTQAADPDAKASGPETKQRPVAARISGQSHLIFIVPPDEPEIPYTLEGLLDACQRLKMSLSPIARGEAGTIERPGFDLESDPPLTAIEAPYRLMLSPNQAASWEHATAPVTHSSKGVDGPTWGHYLKVAESELVRLQGFINVGQDFLATEHTELWHTRLVPIRRRGRGPGRRQYRSDFDLGGPAALVTGTTDNSLKLRAIWSPDYQAQGEPPTFHSPKEGEAPDPLNPFRMSLDANDRHNIVRLTSDSSLSANNESLPAPLSASRFMLSALGAWIDVHGEWESSSDGPTLEEWRHLATMGRDQYVRVVKGGYLFPFGHRASLVKITERKFIPEGETTTAYLAQRMYIIVRQPLKVYVNEAYAFKGTEMPLKSVRITTLVTPNLEKPEGSQLLNMGQDAFWPKVKNKKFKFHLVGTDWDGRQCEFTAPLIYLDKNVGSYQLIDLAGGIIGGSEHQPNLEKINQTYRESGSQFVLMNGQTVAFTASDPLKPGETAYETAALNFEAQILTDEGKFKKLGPGAPRFLPIVEKARVHIPALKHLLGNSPTMKDQGAITIAPFRRSGFDPESNPGRVFAQLEMTSLPAIKFPADKAGGLATPDMTITGMALDSGPVGGDLKTLAGDFEGGEPVFNPGGPEGFFDESAVLLGCIPLSTIIAPGNRTTAPQLTTHQGENGEIITQYYWQPTVQESSIFKASKEGVNPVFVLDAKLTTFLDGREPTCDISGSLSNFGINFLEVIGLTFDKLRFQSVTGKKLDVAAEGVSLVFGGPLEFVNELQKIIPPNGFSDPPNLDVTAEGITAGYTLGLPDIAVGAFSLQNISLSANLMLPFIAKPASVRFSFAERHHPFLLTYSLIGGGGFVCLGVGLDKIEFLEVALEFGGNVALNLGVASGGVSIMAGIHFVFEGKSVQLGGFVRVCGAVEVLGLICISVEFYMELGYQPATDSTPSKIFGEATLTVEVSIAFFSKSVDLTVRREFEDPAPPIFNQLVEGADWLEYWNAFDLKEAA